jgi:hypothetical protein
MRLLDHVLHVFCLTSTAGTNQTVYQGFPVQWTILCKTVQAF